MAHSNATCTCRGSAIGSCHVEPRQLSQSEIARVAEDTGGGIYLGALPEAIPSPNQYHRLLRRNLT